MPQRLRVKGKRKAQNNVDKKENLSEFTTAENSAYIKGKDLFPKKLNHAKYNSKITFMVADEITSSYKIQKVKKFQSFGITKFNSKA